MGNITSAIHMMKKNLTRLRDRKANDSFVKGYEKAIKDVEWLNDKIDSNFNKTVEDYFKTDQRTSKLKRNCNRA